MLISHEVPISMLEDSRIFNNFDYILPHLVEKYPEYYKFYKQSREIYDREVLLDNSIFELGIAFDRDKFYDIITDLKPTMYVVPDVLEDSKGTIDSFTSWIDTGLFQDIKLNLNAAAIGVVQGKTWWELLNCYKYMSVTADMIAISFDYSWYNYIGEGYTKEQKYASGRQRFISQLISAGVWNWNKPHHLLGAQLPQEFSYYKHNNIYNIKSCDSSNPTIHGLHNIKYNSTFGLQHKIKTKLADMIEAVPTEDQLECIMYNIRCFKKITQGQY